MNACNLRIDVANSKALKALATECGTNATKLITYTNYVVKEQAGDGTYVPTPEFAKWYNDTYHSIVKFDTRNYNQLKNRIIRYCEERTGITAKNERVSRLNSIISSFGYTSYSSRILCKDIFCANVSRIKDMIDGFKLINPDFYAKQKEQIDKFGEKTYIISMTRDVFINELVNRIATKTKQITNTTPKYDINKIKAEIKNKILNEKRPYVEEVLGKENMSIQDKNLVAFCFEFMTNPLALVEELSRDSRLLSLREKQEKDKFADEDARKTYNAVRDIQGQEGEDIEDTTDDSDDMEMWQFDHSGTVTSALIHVNDEIRHYFHGLRKINSYVDYTTYKTTPDYDLNNDLGMATTMDVKECVSVMYHYGDYSHGIEGMIASIHKIADMLPGYKSFHVFADELKQNLDFCSNVFRTFGKPVVTKTQVVTEFGKTVSKISNPRSNKELAFMYEFMNDVRVTAVSNDPDYELKKCEDVLDLMKQVKNEINKNKTSDRQDYINIVSRIVKSYYPCVQSEAIASYVNSNKNAQGDVDAYSNLRDLLNRIKGTISASRETKEKYDEAIKNHDYSSSYISLNSQTQAIAMSKMLLPYSLVSVDINSTNVEHNQSSDAINNNMLTDFFTMIGDKEAFEAYKVDKMHYRQYKYSNILVNRDGVNDGFFTFDETTGTYEVKQINETDVPIMSLSLFDGAENTDTDKHALLSKMSDIDMMKTLWESFYSSQNERAKTDSRRGRYFLRTPSDAPRNYAVYAPKYEVSKLFDTKDTPEAIEEKDKISKHVFRNSLTDNDVKSANNSNFILVYNQDDVIKQLTAEDGSIIIALPRNIKASKAYKEGDTVTFKFKYNTGDYNDDKDIYLITGKLSKGRLIDGTLVGIYNNNLTNETNIKLEEYKQRYVERKNLVDYKLHKKHPIFQQLKNVFKQELLDAAAGIDLFFETDDSGAIKYNENDEPIWKPGMSNNAEALQHVVEYYHYKDGKIIEKDDLGKYKLIGNVFHSDRFIVYDQTKETVRNIGQEILDEAFNLLYGAASNKYLHVTKDVSGRVTDITLTEEQEAITDNKIKDFINTYVYDSYMQMLQYENVLGTISHDNVAEFVLNYHLMYNNFNDLFEGDTKFYSDVTKLYKRAKESQGSGVWYAFANLRESINAPRHEIASTLDGVSFGKNQIRIKAYNKFKAITVANTKQVNTEAIKVISKHLKDDLHLSDERVEALMDGYKQGTKINDAQSYITFEEWIRRITGRGELAKYKSLIDKIYNGEELSGEELESFVQVQKNFYYNQDALKDCDLCYPNQIKNAEFVLIPQLVKGTHLEIVLDMMYKYGIDQLNTYETSKAGNSDVLEIFDKKTGDVKQDIIDEWRNPTEAKQSEFGKKVKTSIKLLTYNNLRTQQETPQHLNDVNKAGVQIVKKLFDNIQPDSPLEKYKTEFSKLFSANIDESHENLMRELGIELDENGDIVFEETATGDLVPKGFDERVFYDKLKAELMQRGMDSNDLDYVTFDENGVAPIMPNYRTNISTKLENIAQSIFNNSITRQTLPGFHAAQITNVGWKSIDKNTQTIYSKELKYHVGEKGEYVDYVEIMLPASAFGFKRKNEKGEYKTKDELFRELQDAGLDEIIGYRIPTEGKQSVCKMKVVGFIDDSYGSTIVVPNDWVTQTGSDFDIDSVYGIQFHTYIDKDGHIQKVKYKEAGEFDKKDWHNYLYKHGIKPISLSKDILDKQARIKKFDENEEESIYNKLDKDSKAAIKLFHEKFKEIYGKEINRDIYNEQLTQTIELLNDRLSQFADIYDDEEKKSINEYINAIKEISNNIVITNEITEAFVNIEQQYETAATDNGLMSYENYIEWANNNPEKANNSKARDNKMCYDMIKVLQDDASLEENLSRSNFDKILHSRDELLKYMNNGRPDKRSAYSVLDQLKFQYESASAIALKGISVMYDGFCSICNTVKPAIKTCQIYVTYPQSKIKEDVYNRYKTRITKNKDVEVLFDKYGWSPDNKNVEGEILTSYSSQTTAHILDVVKAGFVPNVTTLTYPVYKLFPNIGIDYDTTHAFIMQPGIKRIIDAANQYNSIYNDRYGNPIEGAIKKIAEELDFTNVEYDDVNDVLAMIADEYETQFKQVTHGFVDLSMTEKEGDNIVRINLELLQNNIKHPRDGKNAALFDLGVILLYNRLQRLTSAIEPIVHCTRPDKFGAKQTLFATNEIFEKAQQQAAIKRPVLVTQSGKNIVEAIYPGITSGLDNFVKDNNTSAYQSLYSFMKRATATSILVNRQLFLTESYWFRTLIKTCSDRLNTPLTEEQVMDFKKYVIHSLYCECEGIASPIRFNISENENNSIGFVKLPEDISKEERKQEYEKERARITGRNIPPKIEFKSHDVYNPTQDEVDEFCKLTPAQKVLWIQKNMIDAGVFNYIKTNIAAQRTKRGTTYGNHNITFLDSSADLEDVRTMFETAFTSANPFMALAAYDVVKYAHVVENYDMKRSAVTRMIPNSVLYNDFGIFGTGVENELSHKIKNVKDLILIQSDKIYDDFVRSRDLRNIRTHKLDTQDLRIRESGIIIAKTEEKLKKYDIVHTDEDGNLIPNTYVNLIIQVTNSKTNKKENRKTTYKIIQGIDGFYFLYPLNPLTSLEHTDFSETEIHPYKKNTYYEKIIHDFEKELNENDIEDKQLLATFDNVAKRTEIKDFVANENTVIDSNSTVDIDFNNPPANLTETIDKVKHDIEQHYGKGDIEPPFIVGKYPAFTVGKYIKAEGKKYAFSPQTLPLHTGTKNEQLRTFSVFRVPSKWFNNNLKPYFGNNKEIAPQHKKYEYVINLWRKIGIVNPNITEWYIIKPLTDEDLQQIEKEKQKDTENTNSVTTFKSATTENVGSELYKTIEREYQVSTEAFVEKAHTVFKRKDVNKRNTDKRTKEIYTASAEYAIAKKTKLSWELEHFYLNPATNEYYSVVDAEVLDLIKNDESLRNKYLKLILDCEAFVNNFKILDSLNLSAEDEEVANNINKIKDAVSKIRENYLVKAAKELFGELYLKNISTNPLLKENMIDVFSSFYSTGYLESFFNDLQETHVPVIQIIAKEVLANLNAREKLAEKDMLAFRKRFEELEQEAAAAGKSVNLDNIIDEYGRFIQPYNYKLIEDGNELYDKVQAAIGEYGRGSIEHLKAQLEYDKWKLKHLNQQVADEYYAEKIKLDEAMLKEHPIIFEAYKRATAKKYSILQNANSDGTLDAQYEEELKDIDKELNEITSAAYYDQTSGELVDKVSFDPSMSSSLSDEAVRNKIRYSIESYEVIDAYIKKLKSLKHEYFVEDVDFGFDEDLDKNLRIVRSYETRDPEGHLKTPMNILLENEDYRNAKLWLAKNAKIETEGSNEEGVKLLKDLHDAFKILKKKGSRSRFNALVKKQDAKDPKGTIDGTKFTADDIKQIKEEQIKDYRFHDGDPYSDRHLINSAKQHNVVYTLEFYRRLTSNGALNPEYLERIEEINKILRDYFNPATKTIDFTLIPNNEEGLKIYEELERLYERLYKDENAENKEERLKHTDGTNGKSIALFIKTYCEIDTNEEEFEKQKRLAETKGKTYFNAWKRANIMVIDGKAVPNPYIYGNIKPKKKYEKQYTDAAKTNALKLINDTMISVPTEYYYQMIEQKQKEGKEAFNKWWNENHVYNPNTHTIEPVRCWTTLEYKPTVQGLIQVWKPRYNRTTSVVAKGKENPNYNPNISFYQNYKTGSGYDNDKIKNANEYELKIKELFKETLNKYAKTKAAKRYINNDYLPAIGTKEKDAAYYVKQVFALFGFSTSYTGKAPFKDKVTYETDEIGNMPMLQLLNQKTQKEANIEKPVKRDDETDSAFDKRMAEYNEQITQLKKENRENHKAALNKDWKTVIEQFIIAASKFNAIQDNKYMLYYGRSLFDDIIKTNKREYGFFGNYKTEDGEVIKEKNTNLENQYENWERRLIYNQWKKPYSRLTRLTSHLQSLTSAQYMMANIRGGIANVTLGKSQIMMERIAKEYFNHIEFIEGEAMFVKALPSIIADMYKDTATSLESAMMKYFHVIDNDGISYRNTEAGAVEEQMLTFVQDMLYSPNSSGENLMQQSALFAAAKANRLYEEVDDATGKINIVFKTEAEAIRDCRINALKIILSRRESNKEDNAEIKAFEKFIANTKSDENEMRKYAHYRRDIVTVYAKQYLNKNEIKDFIQLVKEMQEDIKKEFNNDEVHPTILSQLKLGENGKLAFRENSMLSKYNVVSPGNSVSDADLLLGKFRGRVVSINHKIHGVYDKLGQGQVENTFWGSLLTQYHKHIPMGIKKRFQYEGSYNEERGSIEKGFYISLFDFIATPFREQKEKLQLSDKEITVIESIQNIFKAFVSLITDFSTNWAILEDYEKANIKRALGEMYGVLMALLLSIATQVAGDDDDEDSVLYNLALYEADRLASESMQFNPIGLALSGGSDIKKLWSTPIAAQTGLEDVLKTMGLISDMIMQGDEFDPYYHSGRYAGEHKLSVYVQRRIPVWRAIKAGFIDIADTNSYYKYGENVLGIVNAKKIAEDIKK